MAGTCPLPISPTLHTGHRTGRADGSDALRPVDRDARSCAGKRGSFFGGESIQQRDDNSAYQNARLLEMVYMYDEIDNPDTELSQEVRDGVARILRTVGLTPEQAAHMSPEVCKMKRPHALCTAQSNSGGLGKLSSQFLPHKALEIVVPLQELSELFYENDGDAEDAEAEQKHQALQNEKKVRSHSHSPPSKQ